MNKKILISVGIVAIVGIVAGVVFLKKKAEPDNIDDDFDDFFEDMFEEDIEEVDVTGDGYNDKVIALIKEAGFEPAEYTDEQLKTLRFGLEEEGYDIDVALDPNYDSDQMATLIMINEYGYDTSYCSNIALTPAQMLIIMQGLELGVDVTKYNNPVYDEDAMTFILVALVAGVNDIDTYVSNFKVDEEKIISAIEKTGHNVEGLINKVTINLSDK